MEKILKKLNLFNWLMLLIFFICIILPIYTSIIFVGDYGITLFSSITISVISFAIGCSVFVCLLIRLCTCKVKKEYSKRNKQIVLCLIPLLSILLFIIFIIIGFSTSPNPNETDYTLLNGNYDIYVILSLVSLAIPIIYNFVLLGCTFAFTKSLKQEHKLMIKEKRQIKHNLKVEQKEKIRAEKEIIYQQKIEAKTKEAEKERLHKES